VSEDVKLPDAVEAAIVAALACWGEFSGSCFATVDDHFADCPAKHRPAVRRIAHIAMAEALEWATRHEDGAEGDWDKMVAREDEHRAAAEVAA
jgi:hypothetical protein